MYLSNLSGHKGKELGLVTGEYVASRVFYKDIFASVRNFFGWELTQYSDMLRDAKDEAILNMIKDAESLGATKIVNVKFAITMIHANACVVLVSGTAVRE